MPDPIMMPLADFLELVRTRRDLFPRRRLELRGSLSKRTVHRVIRHNPEKPRKSVAPSLSTVMSLLRACDAELIVMLPARIGHT